MEDIPLRVSMEEQTFDHDESDYLLSAPESGSGVKRNRSGSRHFGFERYLDKIFYLIFEKTLLC